MLKAFVYGAVFTGCVAALSLSSGAQQIIHALTGTVASIDEAAKTITVFQDNGSKGVFQELENPKKARVSFDKKIAAGTTSVDEFNKKGAYAIVFYFGDGDSRTAVALKSLGDGPFASTTGALKKISSREVVVEDKSGVLQTFQIEPTTVAEGGLGAIQAEKFDVQKGDQVRVVSSSVDGKPTALFLAEM